MIISMWDPEVTGLTSDKQTQQNSFLKKEIRMRRILFTVLHVEYTFGFNRRQVMNHVIEM